MWTSTRADGRSQIFVADFRLPTEDEWKRGHRGGGEAPPGRGDAAGHGLELRRISGPPTRRSSSATPRALADDSMEGRRAGTAGAAKAADFIEADVPGANAILPGGEGGTYRQTFEVLVDVEAGIANELKIGDDAPSPLPTSIRWRSRPRHGGMADARGPARRSAGTECPLRASTTTMPGFRT